MSTPNQPASVARQPEPEQSISAPAKTKPVESSEYKPNEAMPAPLSVPADAPIEAPRPAKLQPFPSSEKSASRATRQPALSAPPTAEPRDESYQEIPEKGFLRASDKPYSTFGVDVDTAAWANIRRFLNQGQLPPPDAVRIEEMVNYFKYDYPAPRGDGPFAVHAEVAACPWNRDHRLARIGLKAREVSRRERPAGNIVFLLDVSGSMIDSNKLPLIKEAMQMLTQRLNKRDRVSIVTYASAANLALPSVKCDDEGKRLIVQAIGELAPNGMTQGSDGLRLAYEQAAGNFIPGGINRVILATDGDFNAGVTDSHDLVRLIEEKAKNGVFLTVLGCGTGNLKDTNLEQLADHGNGQYAYLDSLDEARRVLLDQLGGTMETVAKDVKLQVEFNPAAVSRYRLIGYEDRMLKAEDFKNDRKDAGEMGAGHTVTALYELVLAGHDHHEDEGDPRVDPPRYQHGKHDNDEAGHNLKNLKAKAWSGETCFVKIRYKAPDGEQSTQVSFPVRDEGHALRAASPDFRFAAAVAEFGLLLRGSENKGQANYNEVLSLACNARGTDEEGYRAEFLRLVKSARDLSGIAPEPASEEDDERG